MQGNAEIPAIVAAAAATLRSSSHCPLVPRRVGQVVDVESFRNESRLRISRITSTQVLTVFCSSCMHSPVPGLRKGKSGGEGRRCMPWRGPNDVSQRQTTHQPAIAAAPAALAVTLRIRHILQVAVVVVGTDSFTAAAVQFARRHDDVIWSVQRLRVEWLILRPVPRSRTFN